MLGDHLLSDTLTDAGRCSRPPIRLWAKRVSAQLDQFEDSTAAEHVPELAAVINYAALLFAYAGNRSFAQKLCELELDWLFASGDRLGMDRAAATALQPWVNIGRLCRIQGDWISAFKHFQFIYGPTHSKILFERFECDPESLIEESAELLYALENGKTFLSARRLEDGLIFCRQNGPVVTSAGAILILNELEFQFSYLSRNVKQAAAALSNPGWDVDQFGVLVNVFYRTLLGGLVDAEVMNLTVLERIAKYLCEQLQRVHFPPCDHRYMRFALTLTQLLCDAGYQTAASELSLAGYRASEACDDVPMQVAYAEAMLTSSPGRKGIESVQGIVYRSGQVPLAKRYGVDLPSDVGTSERMGKLENRLRELVRVNTT